MDIAREYFIKMHALIFLVYIFLKLMEVEG